ncbi:hypothetical protein RRG08_019697 [Elysia crispata]|uniref:Uncharacterized protein n=1 Tax=Elysia crispata TaxID=231223 RepID=A0AAE0XSA7_9GAST|nr:hypothetical protein RRG08_019697 [Elysia crispata]
MLSHLPSFSNIRPVLSSLAQVSATLDQCCLISQVSATLDQCCRLLPKFQQHKTSVVSGPSFSNIRPVLSLAQVLATKDQCCLWPKFQQHKTSGPVLSHVSSFSNIRPVLSLAQVSAT